MIGYLTDPQSLRPSLGREGWCQRLLTELILDAPYPPYNSRLRPSPGGLGFLGSLDKLCFGEDGVSAADPVFVDEIDFPARHPDEKGCAPDYTVITATRCWIIELKTEPGSHRPRQIPDYFERARHYHPDLQIDITYLTAGLRTPFEPPTQSWERFAHVHWLDIADLVRSTWLNAPVERVRTVAATLLDGITHIGLPLMEWWQHLGYHLDPSALAPSASAKTDVPLEDDEPESVAPEVFQEAVALARETGEDGKQRAIGLEIGGLQILQDLRLRLRQACQAQPADSPMIRVQPWLWSAETSGGRAITLEGQRTGYEVRLSRTRPMA